MEDNKQALQIKYSNDYYVIQANELIRSKQDELTLLETKLIRLAIAQILETDTEFKTYTCNIIDLARYLEIDSSNIYKEMEQLTTEIMRKVITIKSKERDKRGRYSWRKFHWVSMAKYENGEITIKLSDEMTPYLLGLNELFTRYNYSDIVSLPTVYSIRLFELLISYQNMTFNKYPKKNYTGEELVKNEIAFSIDYLRDYFNCESKYSNTGDFIRRVIEPAVKAIKEKTVMRIEYRKIKKGKTITDIVFKLNDWGDTTPTPETIRAREAIARISKELKIRLGE